MTYSDARLEIAARAAGLGVWELDLLDGGLTYSPRAKAIWGFDADRSPAVEDVRALTHPEDRPRTSAMRDRALDPAIREQAPYEYRIIRPDGALRWLVAHGEAVFQTVDGVERAVSYIGTLQDVTESKQREVAERALTDRLRLALDAGAMAVWDYDLESGAMTGSPELYRLLGFAEGVEPTVEAIRAQFPPGEREGVGQAVQEAMAARERFMEAEFRYNLPSGGDRWLLMRAEIAFDGDQPRGLLGVLTDITARKRAEEQLRQSEARFRAMADSAPAPVWVTAAAGGIEFVNEAFCQFAGLSHDALLGDAWVSLIHPDDIPGILAKRVEARAGPAAYSFEARFRHVDGAYRWMLANARPSFDEHGAFNGYIGMAMDLTEIKAADARQRLLINELNHRVKNTLASVQSIARQTLRADEVSPHIRERLLDRLLAMSAAHDVLTRESWEGASIDEIVRGALAPFIDEHDGHRFAVRGAPARIGPNAALALAMAIHELGTNAVKYGALSAPDGRVEIDWTLQEDRRARVRWKERGGPPVIAPARKGFGSRLLDGGLASDLGGRPALTFADDGVEAVLPLRLAD
jgi:PAS domain S-box-containing protein